MKFYDGGSDFLKICCKFVMTNVLLPFLRSVMWVTIFELLSISKFLLTKILLAKNAKLHDIEFYNIVQTVAKQSGINYPISAYIIPDNDLPGLTMGITRFGQLVGISKRVRSNAPIHILKSIIAHELGHIVHRDVLKVGSLYPWQALIECETIKTLGKQFLSTKSSYDSINLFSIWFKCSMFLQKIVSLVISR